MHKVLELLEDPKRPLLGPNTKLLKFTGVILSKNLFLKTFHYFMHLSVVVFVASEFVDIWFTKSDINLLLNNLKLTMLASVTVAKVVTVVVRQKDFISILDYVTRADKEERQRNDPEVRAVIDEYTKHCRKVTYFFWVLMYATTCLVTLYPMVKLCVDKEYRDGVNNGTGEYMEVVRSWAPFDKTNIYWYLFASFYQATECFYGAGVMASFDTTAMLTMVFIGSQLVLLRRKCSQIFGDQNEDISESEAVERIKECHRVRVEISHYVKLFDSFLSPIMLYYVIVCSIMLCASAYQLTNDEDSMQRFFTAEYMVFGISQLFIYCWHSNDVYYKSQEVMLGPFESTWWNREAKLRKHVVLLMAQMQKTVVFTAGKFANLTIPTFISILKGAYSYYTILQK